MFSSTRLQHRWMCQYLLAI
jgi:hypothetical protein